MVDMPDRLFLTVRRKADSGVVDRERRIQDGVEAIHFFNQEIPPLLYQALMAMPEGFRVLDLGCGDGHLVYTLKNAGFLDRAGEVIGVDVSVARVDKFVANTGYSGQVVDGCRAAEWPSATIDLVLSTMVVEHVPDDRLFLAEIRRLLKPGGQAYLSTVFKKPGAWYFRRSPDGRWVLDSTHRREYSSAESFLGIVREAGFEILQVAVSRLAPPIIHPLLRLIFGFLPVIRPNSFILERRWLRVLENVRLPIPRYRSIEVLTRVSGQ